MVGLLLILLCAPFQVGPPEEQALGLIFSASYDTLKSIKYLTKLTK